MTVLVDDTVVTVDDPGVTVGGLPVLKTPTTTVAVDGLPSTVAVDGLATTST